MVIVTRQSQWRLLLSRRCSPIQFLSKKCKDEKSATRETCFLSYYGKYFFHNCIDRIRLKAASRRHIITGHFPSRWLKNRRRRITYRLCMFQYSSCVRACMRACVHACTCAYVMPVCKGQITIIPTIYRKTVFQCLGQLKNAEPTSSILHYE